jgi:hypothetical protein
MTKVANRLEENIQDLEPDVASDVARLVKGALNNTAELIQTKRDLGRDLGRTKYAERIRKQRRALKNMPLKAGGGNINSG